MLNQTNEFLPVAVPKGTRFQSVLVSEFNAAGNPVTTSPNTTGSSSWSSPIQMGRDQQGHFWC